MYASNFLDVLKYLLYSEPITIRRLPLPRKQQYRIYSSCSIDCFIVKEAFKIKHQRKPVGFIIKHFTIVAQK